MAPVLVFNVAILDDVCNRDMNWHLLSHTKFYEFCPIKTEHHAICSMKRNIKQINFAPSNAELTVPGMTGVNLIFCKCCFRTDGQQNSACRHDLLLFYVLRDENFNFSFHISSNKFLNSKLEYLLRGRYIGSIKNRRWDKTIYIDISRAY